MAFHKGDIVTMKAEWLRNTASYFDSPLHHEGEIINDDQIGSRIVTVRWKADGSEMKIRTTNLIHWDQRHKEPA